MSKTFLFSYINSASQYCECVYTSAHGTVGKERRTAIAYQKQYMDFLRKNFILHLSASGSMEENYHIKPLGHTE